MVPQVVKEEGSESCDSSGPPTSSNQQSSVPAGAGGPAGEDKSAEGGIDVKKEEGDEEAKVRVLVI